MTTLCTPMKRTKEATMKVKVSFEVEVTDFQPEMMTGQGLEEQVSDHLTEDERWIRILDEVYVRVEIVKEED